MHLLKKVIALMFICAIGYVVNISMNSMGFSSLSITIGMVIVGVIGLLITRTHKAAYIHTR